MKHRLYDSIFSRQLAQHRQMIWVTGPRQVGKTTSCRSLSDAYHNWDNLDDRRLFLRGPAAIAEKDGLDRLTARSPVLVFDELHKYRQWKSFLKGFFDTYADKARVLVTGSSRLETFRRGGDSLMGRYFLYRMHPFSVGETLRTDPPNELIQAPLRPVEKEFQALWEHGGFPEPFLKRDKAFSHRWHRSRRQQLLKEDLRDLTRIQELSQIEILASLLEERSGQQLSYSNISQSVGTSVDTIRRWIDTLESLHHGFRIRPWTTGVARSLRKEPKWYLRDWAEVADPGARAETFMACHLLKSVEGWTDLGLSQFELRYLRDKEKREVDFVVVKDKKPWFLVEVKKSDTQLDPNLGHYQRQLKAAHAFQVVLEMDHVQADCFSRNEPTLVPARTFLSQLL
jgi:predicted AAA+ superfamily ATPase